MNDMNIIQLCMHLTTVSDYPCEYSGEYEIIIGSVSNCTLPHVLSKSYFQV